MIRSTASKSGTIHYILAVFEVADSREVGVLVGKLRDARFTSVILGVGGFETLMCYCTSVEVQIVFAYPRPVGPVG